MRSCGENAFGKRCSRKKAIDWGGFLCKDLGECALLKTMGYMERENFCGAFLIVGLAGFFLWIADLFITGIRQRRRHIYIIPKKNGLLRLMTARLFL